MSQQRPFARLRRFKRAERFGFRSAITDFYLADPEYVPQLPPQRF